MCKDKILEALMAYDGSDFVVTPNLIGFISGVKVLRKSEIESIIVTAFEGGSMWCIVKDVPFWKEKQEGENFTDFITRMLWEREGFELELFDSDDEGESLGTLTYESLENACLSHPLQYGRIVAEEYDAYDTDVILQVAVMKDVVFG